MRQSKKPTWRGNMPQALSIVRDAPDEVEAHAGKVVLLDVLLQHVEALNLHDQVARLRLRCTAQSYALHT
jgi:hypothetical protein